MATYKDIVSREQKFHDEYWKTREAYKVRDKIKIKIPKVASLAGKKMLICGCGFGTQAVQAVHAAEEGADVYMFDISSAAVEKALEMAAFNGVNVKADVMDFHELQYQDDFFDVIYGDGILHHVDVSVAGRQIFRCLKEGGVAYFRENSDRNPLLRWLRRTFFGQPGGYQRRRFLFLTRTGTHDEYPLTEEEVAILRDIFGGHLRRSHPDFYFFQLGWVVVGHHRTVQECLKSLDDFVVKLFPSVREYSFNQYIWLRKVTG